MKRKFTCMILALVLVISLLPLGAIHTQAASNLNYSENVVNLIKQFEGFSASAYQDVNQWSIGYGTPGVAGQVMTQEQADQLLALIDSCTKVMNYSTSLFDIVNEEVQGYFNDQKSAEETAKMVQSRVSLYVKEQA